MPYTYQFLQPQDRSVILKNDITHTEAQHYRLSMQLAGINAQTGITEEEKTVLKAPVQQQVDKLELGLTAMKTEYDTLQA